MPAPARSGADRSRLLMKKAAGDEAILARLIEDADIPDDALGFHAQQSVEKIDEKYPPPVFFVPRFI